MSLYYLRLVYDAWLDYVNRRIYVLHAIFEPKYTTNGLLEIAIFSWDHLKYFLTVEKTL